MWPSRGRRLSQPKRDGVALGWGDASRPRPKADQDSFGGLELPIYVVVGLIGIMMKEVELLDAGLVAEPDHFADSGVTPAGLCRITLVAIGRVADQDVGAGHELGEPRAIMHVVLRQPGGKQLVVGDVADRAAARLEAVAETTAGMR